MYCNLLLCWQSSKGKHASQGGPEKRRNLDNKQKITLKCDCDHEYKKESFKFGFSFRNAELELKASHHIRQAWWHMRLQVTLDVSCKLILPYDIQCHTSDDA